MGACSDRPGGKVLEKDSPKNLLHNHSSVCVTCVCFVLCGRSQMGCVQKNIFFAFFFNLSPPVSMEWFMSLKGLLAAIINQVKPIVVSIDHTYFDFNEFL
jgi:hypothetical protein